MNLAGACAIVTGGASGIGFAIAQRLVRDGARIVIADIEGNEDAASAGRSSLWTGARYTTEAAAMNIPGATIS
jgi:NAD(P)-dependent dehydrogenase (short-subunit alcohol dehydrogenase family)